MSINKDVIKQCLINKQREVDEAVIVNRPVEFEENSNYMIVAVRHAGKSYLLYQRVRQLQAAGKGWDEILFVDFDYDAYPYSFKEYLTSATHADKSTNLFI